MKDIKDLRKMEELDLRVELKNSKKELFELKMKLSLSELKQTHLLKPLRKYIAVIHTVLSERDSNVI